MLVIEKLSFSYQTPILSELSLSLGKEKTAALIGSSGSGKTTLFKLLTGILTPSSGSFYLDSGKKAAYMTQKDLLLPWRTVLENLTLLSELGRTQSNNLPIKEKAYDLLEEVGLKGYENHYPKELSGGMRQRVSLARALIQDSEILLLDEPFASLDIQLREQMYALLRAIQKRHHTTILMITHDFRDALSLADQIFHLKEGRLSEQWEINPNDRASPEVMGLLQEKLHLAMTA